MANAILMRPAVLAAFDRHCQVVGELVRVYQAYPDIPCDDASLPTRAASARQCLDDSAAGPREAVAAALMLLRGPLMPGAETMATERDELLAQLIVDLAEESCPTAVLNMAIDQLRRSKKWLPTLSEIREACTAISAMVQASPSE